MCGIVGVVATGAVNQRIYDALTVLQHRGQDAAGIATSGDGGLCVRKGSGLVRDVFQQHHMRRAAKAHAGIGHVRYPTAGCDSASEAQPFYVNAPYGICLAHNGNLTNATELAEVLIREDRRHLNTTSDSEVLLNVFASELQRVGTPRVTPADIFAALNAVYRRCRGGYAVVAMVIGHGILGFRDPERHPAAGARAARHAARPGVDAGFGERGARHALLPSWCATSLRARPYSSTSSGGCIRSSAWRPCATPRASSSTSTSPGRTRSSTTSRCIARACAWAISLAEKILRERPESRYRRRHPHPGHQPHQRAAAGAESRAQVPRRVHQEPLHRPHLHHAGTGEAGKSVRRKLNAIDLEFRGKNVLLVDDSIVRGTTSAQIIDLAREAGAKQGLLRLGGAAGALSRTSTASTCRPPASWWPPAAVSTKSASSSAPTGWSTRISRTWSPPASTTIARRGVRYLLLLRRIRHRRCDPEYLERLQRERSDEAKELRGDRRRC